MLEQEIDGYELFRRAIVQSDEEAWAAVHLRYHAMMIAWAGRSSVAAQLGEPCSDIADQALARAWSALTPERFANFATLAQVLSYLRACVATTMIDMARAQNTATRQLPLEYAGAEDGPEQAVLADLDRDRLWRLALCAATSPAERVTLIESFAYGLPPRAIQARHPQIFPDVTAVYVAKRNLFERLQRNPDLQRLNREYIAV
jgi:DNA-directed RNA polymerase specialized sigma24 family protein